MNQVKNNLIIAYRLEAKEKLFFPIILGSISFLNKKY